MDLKRMSHIVAVAGARNLARTAEQVHLSQPALTRSVQAAKAEFGLRLFDMTPGSRRPSGAFVLERARDCWSSRPRSNATWTCSAPGNGRHRFRRRLFPAGTFLAPLLADLVVNSRHQSPRQGRRLLLASQAPSRRRHRVHRCRHQELPHDRRVLIDRCVEPAAFYVARSIPSSVDAASRWNSLAIWRRVWSIAASAVEFFRECSGHASASPDWRSMSRHRRSEEDAAGLRCRAGNAIGGRTAGGAREVLCGNSRSRGFRRCNRRQGGDLRGRYSVAYDEDHPVPFASVA